MPSEADGAVGRIVGRSVMEIAFRVPYGADVTLGEILVGSDEATGRRFLLRVTDVQHGAEATHDDWAERTAGSMLRLDREGQAYDLHDRDARLYGLALATPLGFLEDAPGGPRLRKPKSIPNHFSRVRRLRVDDLAFLAHYEQDLSVGFLRSGTQVLAHPVGIHGRFLSHHIGVFATTGMGKSNLMKTLAGSLLASRRYGLLLFDPHGEYYDGGAGRLPDGRRPQGLRDHPDAPDRLRVYSSRVLSGPYDQLKLSAFEIRIQDVRNLFPFSPAQDDALWAVGEAYKEAWLVELAAREVDELQAEFGRRIQDTTFSVLKRRAEQILRYEIVHQDPTVSATPHIVQALEQARVVLVDTSGLYESEEILASAVLARNLFHRNKDRYKRREEFEAMPPVLIAVEEAQRVLERREGEWSVFAQIAREGRKFKVGLCAVTQQPKLIPEDLLSQFNTFFILGLADQRDREILMGSAKQDIGALEREIQTLEPGEAVITSPNVPFAVPARVHLYEDYLARLPPPSADGARPIRVEATKGFY